MNNENTTVQALQAALEEQAEQYRILREEYRSVMTMSGRTIYRYLVKGRRAVIPPATARERDIPEVVDDLPRWNVEAGRIAPESVQDWYGVFDAIDRGTPRGQAEIIFQVSDGRKRRCHLEFVSFQDKDGKPVSAVISYKDITDRYEHDRLQTLERDALLQIARMIFPEILAINLTEGTYRMLQYYSGTRLSTPQSGSVTEMLDLRLPYVAPEDREAFRTMFYPQGLMEAVHQGKETVQLTYRRAGGDGIWHWMETTAMLVQNPYDRDVLVMAVSRNVDKQKADEELLRQALEATSEQLSDRIYYNGLSSEIFPGLVYISYMDERPSPYVGGQLARRLSMDKKDLALGRGARVHPEDRGLLDRTRDQAEEAGEDSYHVEYRVEDGQGGWARISNQAVAFTDRDGGRGYAHFLTDTTHEHALTERLRVYMEEKLRENEQIFHIVAQHSNRMLCRYELDSRLSRPWDKENCRNCPLPHFCETPFCPEHVEKSKQILPESVADMEEMLSEIHEGTPSGQANVHIQLGDGQRRWFHFKYSSLFEAEQPVAALISFQDITEEHDRELSHMRFIHSIQEGADNHLSYIEADLTADLVEKHIRVEKWGSSSMAGMPYSQYWENYDLGLAPEDKRRAKAVYNRDNLLTRFSEGVRDMDDIWKLEREEGEMWIRVKADLMADPFTNHVRLYTHMTDITEEYKARLAMRQRADHDTMTGLLRRGAGEERIRQQLSHLSDGKGGILILLDMDDLKGVNDTLGHDQGDRAIKSIAAMLRSHFRQDDIVTRLGGDEFMVFLPGAGQSKESVANSMAALIRKLGTITVGRSDERAIHCSAGCAVELPGQDTFETIYRRADLALYHVKRSGKNNFAFYEPDMLQEDYQFKLTQAASPKVRSADAAGDRALVLDMITRHFQEMVIFNLTANRYRIVEAEIRPAMPVTDTIDLFWKSVADAIHPEDRESALMHLSRRWLLACYESGQSGTRHSFRQRMAQGYVETRVVVTFYTDENGEVCAFLFFHREES